MTEHLSIGENTIACDVTGDGPLVAVVRRLGSPAVIVGQSISGGAATIAAATAPDLTNA